MTYTPQELGRQLLANMSFAYDGKFNPQKCMDLIHQGADLTICTTGKHTAFSLAVTYGHTEIAAALLEKKAGINGVYGRYHSTPLMLAVQNKHEHLVKMLLGAGANTDIGDLSGNTALFHAVDGKKYSTAAL
ncbi:MAG: ankyrin repeat domain-containing protein, partial [Alphaproteobacteria bacterium]|nr:ankyrin repeat domain-containing protein [Alphaproteobacteria bacterium]